MTERKNTRAVLYLLVLALVWSPIGFMSGQDFDLDDDDLGLGDGAFDDLLGDSAKEDLSGLKNTVFLKISTWKDVKPARRKRNAPKREYNWSESRGFVTPLGIAPISALIEIPESGEYRIFLRHIMGVRKSRVVTLTITPQKRVEAPASSDDKKEYVYSSVGKHVSHVFGQKRLVPGATGKEQEGKIPVRFEAESQMIAIPSSDTLLWEYWDTTLKKGFYELALATPDKKVQVHSIVLTQAKGFRPSLIASLDDKTLDRLYMRVRLKAPRGGGAKYKISAGLGYHWRGRRAKGSTEPAWYWAIGSASDVPRKEWSPFIEATDAVFPGPGPWSTCNMSLSGIKSGKVIVQLAWYPHEAAVFHEIETGIGEGKAMFRMPHRSWAINNAATEPAPGVYSQAQANRVMTQENIIERYFVWADEAAERLNIKEGHPRLKHLRVFSGCGVLAPNRGRAAEMLAKLGINWIAGAPQSTIDKYGLIDETCSYNSSDAAGIARGKSEEQRAKHTKHKIGDEIGTAASPSVINDDPAIRKKFHAYLRKQAKMRGMDFQSFLGVDNIDDIKCLGHLPSNPGRFQRRLYYHSHRYRHLITASFYKATTEKFEEYFPNINVYNNYSPHPVFLTGSTMNGGNWFVLCRNQAQTLSWGEDWASGGSWGLYTAHQCVSYYAALVDCAARKYNYPSGFYVGVNMAQAARKMFSCVAQGLTWLHLYDWGPIDRWAEGSNAWSESRHEYYYVMCATHALAPADEIIAKGKRETRRVGILYNRSHEIINGGTGRLNHDWMWTFMGLMADQIPVDVLLEEDLNQTDIQRYKVLFLGGFNLDPIHLEVVRKWVEQGNLLIGTGGSLERDIYNDPMPQTVELFGARQELADAETGKSMSNALFAASELYPEIAVIPNGMKYVLTPTTGKSIASYNDGECAAVLNNVGKGKALLLGFHAGFTFRGNGKHTGIGREWLNAPVLRTLGRQTVEFDHHYSEAVLFEHDELGIAVMLNDFGRDSPEEGSLLSIRTDRPIKEVISGLHGPLLWKRNGNRIEVTTKKLDPVDVVILR